MKARHREYQRRYVTKQKETRQCDLVTPPNFSNRMARSRAIGRFRKSLPVSPRQRTQLMASYLKTKSPTVQNLKDTCMNVFQCNSEESLSNSVLADIKSALNKTKKRRSDENIQSRNVIISAISGEKVSESKCKRNLAKYMGVHRRNMTGGQRIRTTILKDDDSSWRLTRKKTRSNKISDSVKRTVYDFWLSSGISRPTGNKKDIKRERLSPRVFVSHTVQVLEVSQTEAYYSFKRQHTGITISQRSFERLKPFFVRHVKESDRNTCMCRYHVELNTVLKSCMKRRLQLNEIRGGDSEQFPVYHSAREILKETLCEKGVNEDHYSADCINRKCDECGVSSLKLMDEERSDDIVDWEKFEYVQIPSKANSMRKKLMLVKKQTSSNEMFSYLCKLLETFASHQFRAVWQNDQLKQNIRLLPLNDVVCIHDFSENYRVASKDELQSDYFQRMEVTVHVTILHRHALLEIDGKESTDENPEIISEQFIVISPDDKHDHHFVHGVQNLIQDYLKSIAYDVHTMHEWTDGCQAQYKSRNCMGDFSYGIHDFGYKRVIRNFFETSHAKGPQDAAGGFIKRQLDTAILRGRAKIQTAYDVYQFAEDNLTLTGQSSNCSRRIFRYADDIDRSRDRYFKPIKDNRSIHQIISTESGDLKVSSLSCYSCENCISSDFDNCANAQKKTCRNVVVKKCGSSTGDSDESEVILSEPFSVKDFVVKGSLVVVYTDEVNEDYFLFRANQAAVTLDKNEEDDWGNVFPRSAEVITGHYYKKSGPLKYNLLKTKTAIISVNSIVCVLDTIKSNAKVSIPENDHEQVLSWIEECNESYATQ